MRSTRTVGFDVYEMYVKGVSTRSGHGVLAQFGIRDISPSTASRFAGVFDEQLEAWWTRALGEMVYLFLDARYEKVRIDGVVRDAAVLSAIGVGPDGRRSLLGVSVELSEAEVHWRSFLESLVEHELHGVQCIASDDHVGLKAARKAVFGGVKWQRCQFHIARNAIHHAPGRAARKRIGGGCARPTPSSGR